MRAYLTINGAPLCAHTACQAGRDDQARAEGMPAGSRRVDLSAATKPLLFCSYNDASYALARAQQWAAAHPHHTVGVILGDCPELGRGVTP
jgi:hypothetical protein